jgi:predicted Zn-dependent peptidase
MIRRPLAAASMLAALGFLVIAAPAMAQDIETFEQNLTVETLDNGLTIMIYERPVAPVVSFFTHVDVGSAQEVPGITGLAHMFEHMAFKGSTVVGTKNYAKEKKALEKVDEAYLALDAERAKPEPDAATLEQLEQAFKDAQEEAEKFIQSNEFDEIVERAGGVGLNAFTSTDTTGYMYSLPANKFELWAYLEAERFRDPVYRQFYKERDVVQEERRMRIESNPISRMIEQFLGTAFIAHPYHHMVLGYMSDLQSFTRQDAEAFYKKYYVPSNITVAIVGDVKAEEILPKVKRYFERLPAGPEPPALRTVEPPQIGEKVIRIPDPAQPIYIEGYHRPASSDPDDAIYNAMADVLSRGRTSRLYRNLVRDKKIAAQTGAFNGFPGDKYPNLMIFYGISTPGHTNEEIQTEIRAEIERIRSEPVSDEELQMVKTNAKADLIRGLSSNSGIAAQLASYQGQLGDWREIFRSVEKIDAVTKDDIMRVAQATFVPTNRTVGMIVTEETEAANDE